MVDPYQMHMDSSIAFILISDHVCQCLVSYISSIIFVEVKRKLAVNFCLADDI